MAQSNYNIPNDSAPAVRAQLNSVFESIATNNSGPTAPTTTFAHQWWYDTDQDILYKRNDTDSGWIVIAEFDTDTGKFLMPAAGLTQSQVQNPSSTDFGTVSGQRLEQQTNTSFNVTGSAPKFACRAWVSFAGSAATILASGNVSSVTRVSEGAYDISFSTSMPDANYVFSAAANQNATSDPLIVGWRTNPAPTASGFRFMLQNWNSNQRDPMRCTISVFR